MKRIYNEDMRKGTPPRIASDCTEEFRERVNKAADKMGMSSGNWVLRAAEEKLGRDAGIDAGPFGQLSPHDLGRVIEFARLLRVYPHDDTLREAIDSNFMLFRRAVGEKP